MFFELALIAAVAAPVLAHKQMTYPCPRYSSQGENCPALPAGANLDYSISSPLGENQPLCKYTTPYATPSATWAAGQSITVKFAQGGAAHGGGHCQFSLSYDGGKTFVVVHDQLEHCFFSSNGSGNAGDVYQYTFSLPSSLPGSDKAIFAWTWINASGNREFYMNCADVAIKGTSGSFPGKEMTIANHNGYPTIPEFHGNPKTGLELYAKAKVITVTGGGSSSGSEPVPAPKPAPGTPSPSPAPAPVPAPDTPEPASESVPKPVPAPAPAPAPASKPQAPHVPHAPKPKASEAPAPDAPAPDAPAPDTPVPSEGSCAHGTFQCSGAGYRVCLYGQWTAVFSCGPGTACKNAGSSVICEKS
ncbi:hypothetical protein GGI12_005397 [Dipsacomyces acuminosporus]|nr:hypothetical protein GGI12_005397 [Dipsacomyces acuminosporus]